MAQVMYEEHPGYNQFYKIGKLELEGALMRASCKGNVIQAGESEASTARHVPVLPPSVSCDSLY